MSEEHTRQSDPLIGETVGEYRIDQRLGSGGMGIVYRGTHSVIGKPVAIKILRSDNDVEHMQRLLAEARTVSQVRHRGIADIFGFGNLRDGRPYIVMELLEGKPLDVVLRERGTMTVGETLWVLEEALGPLAAAHQSGVVHRDIKPSNFFMSEETGGSKYLKVLDFGLAKRRTASENLTAVGSVLGTPDYMSPEQAQAKQVGPASDIYSLGATAFELLTGSPPFNGAAPMEIMVQHVRTPAPRVSTKANGIPPEVDDLIASMLEKDPEKRPSSAAELKSRVSRLRRQFARQDTGSLEAPTLKRPPTSGRQQQASAAPPPGPSVAELPTVPVPARPRAAPQPAPVRGSNTRWFVLGTLGVLGLGAGVALVLLSRGGDSIPNKPPDDVQPVDVRKDDTPVVLPAAEVDAGRQQEPVVDAGVAVPQVVVDAGVVAPQVNELAHTKKNVIKKKPPVDNSLEGRIKRGEAELRARAKAGNADSIATTLLKSLKEDLLKNRRPRDRVAKDLNEWEQRYLQ